MGKIIGGGLATAAISLALAGAAAAEVTIGPDVSGPFNRIGVCGGLDPANRPCTVMSTLLPGRQAFAPCAGTVTRFRLNGVPTADTYRLRIVSGVGKWGFTGTGTSSPPVQIASEGVNEYPTSLRIAEGSYIGIDFQGSTAPGLRLFDDPGVTQYYFYAFPPDGGLAAPTGIESSYYLFNADVRCDGEGANPGGGGGSPGDGGNVAAPPAAASSTFKFVKLQKQQLILEVASFGKIEISGPSILKKRGAGPKLLKRSSAEGGPGLVSVPLRLTGAGRQILAEAGKVKVTMVLSFTPVGGDTASRRKTLMVRAAAKPVG